MVDPNPVCVDHRVKITLQFGEVSSDSTSFTFTKVQYELTDPSDNKITIDGDANTLAEYKPSIVGKWKVKLVAAEGSLLKKDGSTFKKVYSESEYPASETFIVLSVNLDIGSVADAEEESKGGYLGLNSDDDNGNGQKDKDESGMVAGENDLIELKIELEPNTLDVGTLKLEATAGGSKVKVWKDATKGTEVVLPITWTVGSDTIPAKLYLEGVETSGAERDVALKLLYTHGTLTCSDIVKATVVFVDLNIGNVLDEEEETKGGYLALNDDDDNKNKQKDKDESGMVAGENDLIELKLKLEPSTLKSGTLKLSSTAGTSKVKVWETATKGTEVVLPKTWTIGSDTIPAKLYLEGVETSGAERDVQLVLEYTADAPLSTDKVNATVVKIKLQELSFSGEKYHAVRKDDGSGLYSAPQWTDDDLDGKPEKAYPIAFTRDTKLKVSAKFKVEPAINAPSFEVRAESDGNIKIPATNATIVGTTLTMSETEADAPFADKIDYYEKLTFDWEVQISNHFDWTKAGTSGNQTYVTLGDPGAERYHTLFDIGCKNGKGETTEDGAVTAIFDNGFAGLNVKRADGSPMTYWGAFVSQDALLPEFFTTAGLIKNKDGRCGAWAEFLRDVYRVQGIAGSVVNEITTKNDGGLIGRGFLVKAVHGQNNDTPWRLFRDHAVVVYGGKIYDPSYGTKFDNLASWEDASISAFIYTKAGERISAPNKPSPSEESKLTPSPN